MNLIKWHKPYRIRKDGAINLAPGILRLSGWRIGDELEVAIDQQKSEILLKRKSKKP